MPLVPSPSPTSWAPTLMPTSSVPLPTPTPTKQHASIWRVDYNAMVEKDAAMGWQGLGYVLLLNTAMFAVAFLIFQTCARSTRFSLYHFRTSATSPPPACFTLRKWAKLLWRTPIQGTTVETRLGPEGTFYLVYQVYALRLLLVLSAYALLVLIPLYLSVGAGLLHEPSFNGSTTSTINATSPTHETEAPLTPMPTLNASLPVLMMALNATSTRNATGNEWWSFAHATIRSLPNDSVYLWVPVATCYVFTAAFVVFFHGLSSLSRIPTANAHEDDGAEGHSHSHGQPQIKTRSTPPSKKHKHKRTPKPPRTPVKKPEDGQDPAQQTEEVAQLPPTTDSSNSSAVDDDVEAGKSPEPEKEKEKPKSKSPHLTGMQASELSLRSLFVDRGFPKNLREERLLFLLQEVFPGYIDDVCVVYNLAAFYWYESTRLRREAKFDREKLMHEMVQRGERMSWSLRLLPGSMKFPYLHRILLAWFCCRREPFDEPAMRSDIQRLKDAEDRALEQVIKDVKGAGRAFLVFKSARLRARFVRRVRNASVASMLAKFPDAELPRLKKYVRELGITRWHLSAAPEPDDIDWLSVSFPIVQRTAVVIVVNVLILALLLTFTSPVAVTSAISSSTSYSNTAAASLSDLVAQISDFLEEYSPQMAKMMTTYVPTLILVMINAVLLNVLQIAGRIQPIATDSAKERMILRTSAVYLIFNTLFVPSLAFVSIDAVLLYLQTDGQVLDMLGTLFLHNSGIFYVNYVLQRCFLGTAVNMLRLSEYAKFSWEKPRAITPQEHVDAIEAWPFFTGTQSALQISMLVVVLTFSTVVPLILPIGALYFAMQHAVDKYALLFVRPRIKGRGSIARTATHATMVSLLIYQGAMSGFFLVRGTKMQSSSVLVLLMATYIISLWWYIRDKERAYGQTRRGHHVHGPQCKQKNRESNDKIVVKVRAPPQAQDSTADESTALLKAPGLSLVDLEAQPPQPPQPPQPEANQVRRRSIVTGSSGGTEASDLYRAPALRKHGKNSLAVRAAVDQARRTSYGTYLHGSSLNLSMHDAVGGGRDSLYDSSRAGTPRSPNGGFSSSRVN